MLQPKSKVCLWRVEEYEFGFHNDQGSRKSFFDVLSQILILVCRTKSMVLKRSNVVNDSFELRAIVSPN